MSEPTVHYELRGAVAVLTLSAPPANCYSYVLMQALDRAILQARIDPAVQAIVLTGQGHRFFCAGADIAMLQAADPTWKYYFCLHANETLLRLEHTPKVVIAALNGHTVGGGLEVALACDLRIARRGAGRIGLPEAKLGVLPGTGGTQRLTRLVGHQKALRWMLDAATFPIDEAVERGLADELLDCEAEDFLDAVIDRASRVTTPAAASLALGGIKRAVIGGGALPLEQGLALERELQAQLFASADAAEGLTAYGQKRTPRFEGR